MKRQDPREMARWLVQREKQDLSWVELSRRSGHPTWKLQWWQKRLERTPIVPDRRERGFVAVTVTEPARTIGASIEITTPSGYRVQVAREFDTEQLRRVLHALEHGC